MNIKLLTLGPQNFYHTSMVTPEAKPKTQNPNLKYHATMGFGSYGPLHQILKHRTKVVLMEKATTNLKPKTENLKPKSQNPKPKSKNPKP